MSGVWPPLIDPQLQLDRQITKRVYRDSWGRWLNNPKYSMLYTGGLVSALFAFLFIPDLIEPLLGGHRWYHTLFWSGLYIAGIGVFIWACRNYGYAKCVYEELRDRGHDVCGRCGYLLKNLSQEHERCPECGSDRVPLNLKD